MAEKKHNIGNSFLIKNLGNLTRQHIVVGTDQVPMSLNNPPPGFLRGRGTPGSTFSGVEQVSPAIPIVFALYELALFNLNVVGTQTIGGVSVTGGTSPNYVAVVGRWNLDTGSPAWLAKVRSTTGETVIGTQCAVNGNNGDCYFAGYFGCTSAAGAKSLEVYDDNDALVATITGFAQSSGARLDQPWLLKFNASGVLQWAHRLMTINGPPSNAQISSYGVSALQYDDVTDELVVAFDFHDSAQLSEANWAVSVDFFPYDGAGTFNRKHRVTGMGLSVAEQRIANTFGMAHLHRLDPATGNVSSPGWGRMYCTGATPYFHRGGFLRGGP